MVLDRAAPRSGEFFAPLPLAVVALLVSNDVWLKPTFHNFATGKLSDVAVCFSMPLFISELLGLALGVAPRLRLGIGAVLTAALFSALELSPWASERALAALGALGPWIGLQGGFEMTADVTDLACVPLVLLAYRYGGSRLRTLATSSTLALETPGT
jgi:hypothetical protein